MRSLDRSTAARATNASDDSAGQLEAGISLRQPTEGESDGEAGYAQDDPNDASRGLGMARKERQLFARHHRQGWLSTHRRDGIRGGPGRHSYDQLRQGAEGGQPAAKPARRGDG